MQEQDDRAPRDPGPDRRRRHRDPADQDVPESDGDDVLARYGLRSPTADLPPPEAGGRRRRPVPPADPEAQSPGPRGGGPARRLTRREEREAREAEALGSPGGPGGPTGAPPTGPTASRPGSATPPPASAPAPPEGPAPADRQPNGVRRNGAARPRVPGAPPGRRRNGFRPDGAPPRNAPSGGGPENPDTVPPRPRNQPESGRPPFAGRPGGTPRPDAFGGPVPAAPSRLGAPPTVVPTSAGAPAAPGAAEETVRVPAATPTAPPAAETAARTAEEVEETTALASRVRRIDESLTRLTAAHAGMALQTREGEEPEPDEDESAEAPATPTRRPVLAVKILVAAVAFLLFAGTALSWGAFRWMESTIRPVDALDPTSGSIVDAAAQAGDDTVVVLGTASGSSGDTASTGTRTDTVVLTHVAASGDRVVTVSLPTDLEINRPPCQRWDQNAAAYLDETVPAETRTTLGSAYEVGGPRCTVRAVQQLTGLAVTRFVALDMPGVKDMVDALGGVEVCVERPVVDDRLGPVVPQAGTTTLDGEQAVRFAEASAVPTDSSPAFGQAQRQQRLLAAVFGEALSTHVLLSPGTTRDVVTALGHSMLADNAGMQDLLALSTAQRRLDADGVTFVPLPVSGVPNTRGNLELRTGDANELFSAMRKDRPLPESATAPAARSTAAAPDSVTVDVLNAAGRDGLATQIGTTLRGLGYGVGAVSNAPEPSADTVVKFSADRSAQAQAIAGLVPTARLVPDTGTSGSLQLVLGTSFDGTVRTPAQGAVAPAAQPATASPATCD